MRAIALNESGWRGVDIARALNVSSAAVSQWLRTARENGIEAIKSSKATGRPARLTERHRLMVTALIREDARHFGFLERNWKPRMLQQLIASLFGVVYSRQHVGTILASALHDGTRLPKMLTIELSDLLSTADITVVRGRFHPKKDVVK